MCGFFKSLVFVAILLWVTACGREESGEGAKSQLLIQLPKRLSSKTKRLESFLTRVVRWEVYLEQKGEKVSVHNGPLDVRQGMDIPIPPLELPYTLIVKVWDTTHEGYLRSFPVLAGSKKITESNFAETWRILLKLQVSVTEFEHI